MSVVATRPIDGTKVSHSFRVWIRPMGASVKIAVEAGYEANWLINRLAQHGFKADRIVQDLVDLHCTFQCLIPPASNSQTVTALLNKLPEVNLQLNPEFALGHAKLLPSPHLSQSPLDTTAQPDTVAVAVEPFQVWVRPLGNAWKLRVQGADASAWLREELVHRGLTCSPQSNVGDSSMHTFQCMSETPHEACYVWSLLKALPQVLLQHAPA